eukprot:956241-Pyramimonas_sp.AAC.1
MLDKTCKFLRGSVEQRIAVWALDPVSVVFVTASGAGGPGSARRGGGPGSVVGYGGGRCDSRASPCLGRGSSVAIAASEAGRCQCRSCRDTRSFQSHC